jgi:hypothetical protein
MIGARNKRSFARVVHVLALGGVLGFGFAAVATDEASAEPAQLQAPALPLTANADIMVLHATQVDGPGSIDPRIGSMPQLKKPPFSAYNTYKLLDRKVVPLEKGKAATYALQNGRTLDVTLIELTSDKRYKVAARIEKDGKDFLKSEVTAAANEPFFVAGQSHQGGILVLGITLRP